MPDILLTIGAEADLNEIAISTADTWGIEPARTYGNSLTRHFRELADDAIRTKATLPGRGDIRVSRCERHYVFSVKRGGATVILAVLHERWTYSPVCELAWNLKRLRSLMSQTATTKPANPQSNEAALAELLD